MATNGFNFVVWTFVLFCGVVLLYSVLQQGHGQTAHDTRSLRTERQPRLWGVGHKLSDLKLCSVVDAL